METKVVVLGQTEAVKPELKKIEFVKRLNGDLYFDDYCSIPSQWENIELICSGYKGTSFDLMFAYDDNRHSGSRSFYLGHFNDGVV